MPAKKTTKKRTGAVAAPKAKPKAAPKKASEKPEGNFLVLRVGSELRVNSSVTFLTATSTLDQAKKYVESLSGSAPALLAIVEKKAVLSRAPKMSVTDITDKY